MTPSRRRVLNAGARLLAGAALAPVVVGCAGSARPKPAELAQTLGSAGVGQAWSLQLPGKINFPLYMTTVGAQVVLGSDDGSVVTLDAGSGRELARASAGAPLTAGVGSDGRIAAVVTRSNEVVALQGGAALWRRQIPTQAYTAPLVAGARVFVLGADRALYAFDAAQGTLLWQLERKSEPLALRQNGLLMPVGNTLIAGLGGRMVGVNPDSGTVLWEAPLAASRGISDIEKLVDLLGGVYRQQDVVCARAFEAAIGCVDTRAGAALWTAPARGVTGLSGDPERIYGVESDGRVRAWRTADGARAWVNDQLQWRRLGAPLLLGRSVIVGDDEGAIYLLASEDGRLLGRVATHKSGVAGNLAAAAGTLVVATQDGQVFGLRTS